MTRVGQPNPPLREIVTTDDPGSASDTFSLGTTRTLRPSQVSGGAEAAPRAGGTHERAPGGPGLVICAKTPRVRNHTASEQGLWRPAFPSADLIRWAADELPKRDKWDGHEGPRPRIMIGPGCITISRPNLARWSRRRRDGGD